MEDNKNKRISDANREKCKKKTLQEKKTKSDTAAFSASSFNSNQSSDGFIVVGKGCFYGKSKSQESYYRLHDCHSEADITPLQESNKYFRDFIQGEGLQSVASNSSFASAKSDFSDAFQKKIHDLEDALNHQIVVISALKKQLTGKDIVEVSSVSTGTDLSFTTIENHRLELKAAEKKINSKEKKIKELEQNLIECSKVKDAHIEENKVLKNKVSLLNRQIQSLYDLLKNRNWTTIDPTEFASCKNKITELESLVASQEREKTELFKKISVISSSLETKENELSAKSRELMEYKNKSTLEMCKLFSQIDCAQKEAKNQSQLLDLKISEAQNSVDEELVSITHKLEEQYQKDLKSAVEKFHADFEKLAELPKTAIEKLLQLCEPDKIDFISYQKEWDKQQKMLEARIETLEMDRSKEIAQLKDDYEAKIAFLKTQIEALLSQLKERKDIINIFENELKMYKSNSAMDLLKASSVGDDLSALKELYSAEIFSQKQIHKLQVNIFEEKVKALTDEILHHARNEEIHHEELENAKKMAFALREKYEKLVCDWEEKSKKYFNDAPVKAEIAPELDTILTEFQNLIQTLKKSEQAHEEMIQKMVTQNKNEKVFLLQNIQELKDKLEALNNFQKIQVDLDTTIGSLVEAVGNNYCKALDAFLLSHMTELSLKEAETFTSERSHIAEVETLKNDHAKQLEELRNKVESLEKAKIAAESQMSSLRKTQESEKIKMQKKIEEFQIKLLKSEGIISGKEEIERALNEKIEKLEKEIRLKKENCQKELTDLTAKYLKEKALSSAKEDLAKELEDDLNESESLLVESCEALDRLIGICYNLENISSTATLDDRRHEKNSQEFRNKFLEAKTSVKHLKTKFTGIFEEVENLKNFKSQNDKILILHEKLQAELKLLLEKNAALEEEKNQILEENSQLKKEITTLATDVKDKDKMLTEMGSLQEELSKMSEIKKQLEKEKMANEEKKEILKRNEILENTVEDLMERVDMLTAELAQAKMSGGQEVVSVTLQQVRFLYEEEEKSSPISDTACQTESPPCDLLRANEELKKEVEMATVKFKGIQEELSIAVKERNELLIALKNVEREKEMMKEILDKFQKENPTKSLAEKETWICDSGRRETNREIGRLHDYIKVLSNKLDVMKANNELLLSESQEHFRLNQNLVSELKEAWSQRYEIEDQLAKVRKENALLNLHRRQLEETNKKISSLLAEGHPSVVSWIKIHETVESIVDEVLALKTSFSDSGSAASTEFDLSKSNSDLKLMTDNLHAQLKNKTMLCDEVIAQKETLQRELRNLENFILENDSEAKSLEKNAELWGSKIKNGQQAFCSSNESQNLSKGNKMKEVPYRMTSKNFKEDEQCLEEALICENWQLEVEKSNEKMQDNHSENDDMSCLKSIQLKYEEEVGELSKEFEKEVEKLRKLFASDEENSRDGYEIEIENLKKYFEQKWADLEKRYTEMYNIQNRKRGISSPPLDQILEQLRKTLREEINEEEKRIKIENLVINILTLRRDEMKLTAEKYKEALKILWDKHASEVEKLQSVVRELKEKIMLALNKETEITASEKVDEKHEDLFAAIRDEYETKLENERKKHEKEISDLEEFWTEKLSECETKCAIMKATGKRKTEIQENQNEDTMTQTETSEMDQLSSEEKAPKESQIVKYKLFPNLNFDEYKTEELNARAGFCISCLANQSFFRRMELKTDDDKLDVIHQRDALGEMIYSMRSIITKLLAFIGQQKPELNNTSIDIDETLYKSIHLDLNRTVSDASVVSNSVLLTMDLSAIFQEIKENSLLSSSDRVRFELEKCLKQLRNDADGLFALSCAENSGQNLNELLKKVVNEKKELEAKVLKVEEIQNEMRKEISVTKERLSQWERNLEVVSEGYGEEVIEPKQTVSLADIKEKLKLISSETCSQFQQDNFNILEEICKEGERLQEEWLKEKCDLQQQIDVADKQLHSLRKFLEEQAVEREQEREAFDREINELQENLKAKERDSSLQTRTNREVGCLCLTSLADYSVEALTAQTKDLSAKLVETEKNKEIIEGEFQNAVKKIWSLREVIQDLEVQLAEVSERESNLKKKVEKMDDLVEEQSKANRNLKDELETFRNQNELKYLEHIKSLEEELVKLRHIADQVNPDTLTQLKANLRQIEAVLIKKTKDLEQLHVSSANVSCSSPSEDISIRDHIDATRCSTPDEMCSNVQPVSALLPMEEIDRVHEKLARHSRAEEVAIKHIQDLKMQLRNQRKTFEEIQTERDVLLEKLDGYLKENSSLKVRLEEQRCNAGLLQKQLNANLESQINRLEVDVEKLNELCNEKDKQLKDMKVMLENTTKSLKLRETEALNKSKEENKLITTLKTDLANALNENEKLEEKLEKTKEKLKETLKMPALIDSMIDEKNAEIDRLEKEVARLSSEKNSSGSISRSYTSEEKQRRKIRFSEPESFSENISSISVHYLSDLRNCSETCADLKNSSFKSRRPIGSSTKIESISSIAPLQLSPRGADSSFHWKTSSPILLNEAENKYFLKTIPAKPDISQLEEVAKLQEEIESKQREISELHLEIDILKRQLVETNQEVASAKSESKEIQNELSEKDEEIRKLKTSEKNLLMTMDSLKKNHAEELDELQNQLNFEHRKVEKVFEEIKALEVKKIEIEESFLSLKEDYNEKINGEKKTAEALMQRISTLEAKNEQSELRLANAEKELEKTIKESEKLVKTLTKEISELKTENEKIRLNSQKKNAETQMDGEPCVCRDSLAFEIPVTKEDVVPNLEDLKANFDKMAAEIGETDFNRKEAFLYAMAVRRLLLVVLNRVDQLSKEVEAHMRKVMESSVDELALKVQKELVLSAKLDNQLLSSIEANGFGSNEATSHHFLNCSESFYGEVGGGDGESVVPTPLGNAAFLKVASLYKDIVNKMTNLETEREYLQEKVSEQQKIIRLLEESLKKEKERILEEKERCSEDAKIMELLRVNLEKRLNDIKTKEKELKKEKHQRMALEKELESLRQETKGRENKKISELNAVLESQKNKITSLEMLLKEEQKKNQDLRMLQEEERIERITEKNAYMLMESDLNLLREQKDNFKKELLSVRQLLHARNVEIGNLKKKINLQEIDIKALILSSNSSDRSSISSNGASFMDSPFSLLVKMRKLNSCVERHVKESSEMGETLLNVSQETEQMKDVMRKLEEDETRLIDETLVPDTEVEKRLWALEKGKLVMDLDALQRENEILKHDLLESCKNNDVLKQENTRLKMESRSPNREEVARNELEDSFLQGRVSHLMRKCLRIESYRKALAWQKHYLMITLKEYQRSEEEAWKRLGRRKKDGKRKGLKALSKFRVVALAVVAVFRMKFIVKRWQKNALTNVVSLWETKTSKPKQTPLPPMLNIYNEPLNPLLYQTQNIIRSSPSKVLRTPPCRDPGPRGFSLDSKISSSRLEKFDFL